MTVNKAGQLYLITPPSRLLILNPNGRVEKEMTIESRPAEGIKLGGGWPTYLALDEKNNRLYASGNYAPARKWHIWYWDLNANGAFHGEAAARAAQPGDGMFGGQPGSYKDGWSVYPEGGVWFGPDDPDCRFLYTSRTDCGNSYRLDLEKKEVWILNGPNKAGKGIKYSLTGPMVSFEPHTGPGWLENGDFYMPRGGSQNLGLFLFKRVK
jgi:hypothetical protein